MSGLPWIQLAVGMPDHPKVRAMACELGIDRCQAVGHLIVLWTSCGRIAPTGEIGSLHAEEVLEEMAAWHGEKGKFAAAAVACGLVDRSENTLSVHDWQDHAGAFVEKFRKDAERHRRFRNGQQRPHDVRMTSVGRPHDVRRERERERESKREKVGREVDRIRGGDPTTTPPHQPFLQKLEAVRLAAHPGTSDSLTSKQAEAAGTALSEHGEQTLLDAFNAFLADTYWNEKAHPVGAFMAQLPSYLGRKVEPEKPHRPKHIPEGYCWNSYKSCLERLDTLYGDDNAESAGATA